MSRCAAFYQKWRRDPNWCKKCENEVYRINQYLGLVDEIKEKGTPEDLTFVKLPETAARPILAIQDEEIKENVISSVSNAIKLGKNPITGSLLKLSQQRR
jgi:hypothetical protein